MDGRIVRLNLLVSLSSGNAIFAIDIGDVAAEAESHVDAMHGRHGGDCTEIDVSTTFDMSLEDLQSAQGELQMLLVRVQHDGVPCKHHVGTLEALLARLVLTLPRVGV